MLSAVEATNPFNPLHKITIVWLDYTTTHCSRVNYNYNVVISQIFNQSTNPLQSHESLPGRTVLKWRGVLKHFKMKCSHARAEVPLSPPPPSLKRLWRDKGAA
jgi:hypothetical protein